MAVNKSPAPSITLHAIFNTIDIGICILDDREYTIKIANKAAERIFESTVSQLKGTSVFDFACEKDRFRKELMDSHKKLPEAGIIHFEAQMLRSDGSDFPAQVKLSMIIGEENGGDTALLLVINDVTQRVYQDQSLAELESRYRLLFDKSNDAILVVDLKSEKIIETNQTTETKTGYSRDELIGMTLEDLTPPSRRYLEREGITRLYAEGNIIFEGTYIRKDKVEIPVQISMALAHLSGQIVIISSFRDISEQKEIEKERMRTARLDAVRKIAGAIAHEANQPLQSLMSIADIVSEEDVDVEKIRKLVSNIPILVNRMNTLLKQMQRIVRVETKSYTDESDIVDIDKSSENDEGEDEQ